MSRLLIPAVAAAALLACPALVVAAPPKNDNYLASSSINAPDRSLPHDYRDRVDTSEATTQSDTFDPSREGLPFGGGKPEPTSCSAAPAYGASVWYDFAPPVAGGVALVATGLDAVIAVHEWNPRTSQLGAAVACRNASAGSSEELLLGRQLRPGRSYTIQLAGAGGARGLLDFRFTYFPDRDDDGILDEQPDKCPALQGIAAFGGCPPVARGSGSLSVRSLGGAVRVVRLVADRVVPGSRLEARCRRCGKRFRTRGGRDRTVRLSGFDGRVLRAGDRVELRITHPRARSGRYRFGAIGKLLTWPITTSGLGPLKVSCSAPGSSRKVRCP